MEYYGNDEFDKAIDKFNKVLVGEPYSVKSLVWICHSYYTAEYRDEGIETGLFIMKLDKNNINGALEASQKYRVLMIRLVDESED